MGRVLDLPYARCDAIAKMIPGDLGMTLDKALKQSPDLREAYQNDDEVHYLIDMAKRLEGLPRHTSMHAAGVVIGQRAMDEFVPLSRASDGTITTQFTMTTLEELGLLKMDFLGLRTLTVIQNAVRQAEENYGVHLEMEQIDYNDKHVLASIGTGKCDGIFQLESSGMKSFMKELRPENLEDIIAGISLYRPGPMDFIPRYLKGKNDKDSITYECPQLEHILGPTYGCIVYQEQVMQIVRDLAGYTMGRSDLVRRAMSKKKTAVMEKERQNFVYGNPEENVKGCIANGIDEKTANHIYDEMIDFAKYAFNKSHAACYAVVAYQTAYLKYYYPKEFFAALMTSVMDNVTKVSEYILTCRQLGIRILPPDINEGQSGFSVSGDAIRYGLSAIKSVGRNVVDEIIKERKNNGLFTSIDDFVERMGGREVNKRTLENFIKSGAMDSLPGNRRQKTMIAPELLDQKTKDRKNVLEGQLSLFDFAAEEEKQQYQITMPDVPEFPKEELLAFEKEILGIYISGHPMDEYLETWKNSITAKTTDFMVDEESGRAVVEDGVRVTIGGMITAKTVKLTKNGQQMAFVTVEDMVGSVEVIVFPRDYESKRNMLNEDAKVFISGRTSIGDDPVGRLICEQVIPFDQVPKDLWLKFTDKAQYDALWPSVSAVLRGSDGNDTVIIYLEKERAKKILPANWHVAASETVLSELMKIIGEKNVKVVEKGLKR